MSRFAFAPLDAWRLDNMGEDRQARLLGETTFEEIVARINGEATLGRFGWNRGRCGDKIGKRRWWVKLVTNPDLIDLWHNARGGYRAQYYVDAAMGDDANAFARRVLAPTATRLIQCDPDRQQFLPEGVASITHFATRLWVHQGRWLRYGRKADGQLYVSRWVDNARKANCAKFGKWARLTPRDETGLVLKGQWIDNGKPVAKVPKSARGRQLHRFGFT
jgi:hypothetical protein